MDIIYIVFAYLTGSIPTAYIYFKIKNKQDIRNYGSGNSGTLNIFRSYSFKAATIVLLLDLIKSSCIAIIGKNINISDMTFYFATIMAVIGHNFPFYLKFKGGKGVAVASGITLIAIPIPAISAGITIAILTLILKSPLWGIFIGALVLNALNIIINQSIIMFLWCGSISLIILFTHLSRRRKELIPAIKAINLKKIREIE